MSREEVIKIENEEIYLTKSNRAKHIFLKQNTNGKIILICPRFCPKIMAIAFAKKQVEWIHAHAKYGSREKIFFPGEEINLLGKRYLLLTGKRTAVLASEIVISGESCFFHRRVCSVAQKELLSYIQNRVKELTEKLGVKAGRITLRNTSSRWGSCSSSKNLSFCWKIAFAPIEVIDYLIAHEVAHLIQMNHSDKFWKLVDSLTDKRIEAEKWLKKNGHMLQSIK